jgi:hypothetical protein
VFFLHDGMPSVWNPLTIWPTINIFFSLRKCQSKDYFVCIIISVSRQESGRHSNPKGLAASFSWINYSSNYFVNIILIIQIS